MHLEIITVQLLDGSRTDQLLEMESDRKATNVTSLHHHAPGTASGGDFGLDVMPLKTEGESSKVSSGRMETSCGGEGQKLS